MWTVRVFEENPKPSRPADAGRLSHLGEARSFLTHCEDTRKGVPGFSQAILKNSSGIISYFIHNRLLRSSQANSGKEGKVYDIFGSAGSCKRRDHRCRAADRGCHVSAEERESLTGGRRFPGGRHDERISVNRDRRSEKSGGLVSFRWYPSKADGSDGGSGGRFQGGRTRSGRRFRSRRGAQRRSRGKCCQRWGCCRNAARP